MPVSRLVWCIRCRWCKCKIKCSETITQSVRKKKNLIYHALTSFLFIYAFIHLNVVGTNATKLQFIAFSNVICMDGKRVAWLFNVHALDMLLLIFLCSILYRFLKLSSYDDAMVRTKLEWFIACTKAFCCDFNEVKLFSTTYILFWLAYSDAATLLQ